MSRAVRYDISAIATRIAPFIPSIGCLWTIDEHGVRYYPLQLIFAGALLLAGPQHAAGQDAALRAMQRQLSAKGYKLGTPDGFMGKRTEEALRTFQRDRGLEQTGRLNRDTVSALQDVSPAPQPVMTPSPETAPAQLVTPPAPSQLNSIDSRSSLPAPAPMLAPPTIDDVARPSFSSGGVAGKSTGISLPGWAWLLASGLAGAVIIHLRRLSQRPISTVPLTTSVPLNEKASKLPTYPESPVVAVAFNPLRPAVSPTDQRSTRPSSKLASYVAGSNNAAVASASAHKAPEFHISPIIDTPTRQRSGSAPGEAGMRGVKGQAHDGTAWIHPGKEVRVKDIAIRGGFFYLGEKLGTDTWNEENCLVRPSLPVAKPGKASAIESGYYRHYSHAPPEARRAYLEWLASGRYDPTTPAGLVALYFFGLEYRMFRDVPGEEGPALVAEVERLRQVYGGEDWLCRYFDAFLVAARVGLQGAPVPILARERASYLYEIPFDLRMHLGTKIAAKQPFDADDALLWIANVPDVHLRTPALRCRDEFKVLWTVRFGELYPGGLRVKAPKKRLKLLYQAASGTFETSITGPHEALPDIVAVSGPIAKLRELVDACTTELEPFSRLIGRRPLARDSSLALLLLPEPLRKPALKGKLSEGVDRLAGPARVAIVPYRELLSLIDPELAASDKPQAAIQDQVARILGELDFAVEPDRRYGGRAVDATTQVALFSAIGGAAIDPDSGTYQSMRILVEVAVLAAASDGEITDDEIAAVRGTIERQGLTQAEKLRLIAFAASLRLDRPKQQSVLRKLQELPKTEREVIAHSALATVMSDGVASAAEVGFLEQLYRALGLSTDDVYGAIHRFSPDGHTPARPISNSTGERTESKVAVDPERLRKLRQETQEVSRLLSDIFVEDSVDEPSKTAAVEASAYAGLDQAHAALLDAIDEADGGLSRSVYDEAARRLGLLPDGAIETLNDWAFDRFDESLIETDVEIMIVPHLRANLREAKVSPR